MQFACHQADCSAPSTGSLGDNCVFILCSAFVQELHIALDNITLEASAVQTSVQTIILHWVLFIAILGTDQSKGKTMTWRTSSYSSTKKASEAYSWISLSSKSKSNCSIDPLMCLAQRLINNHNKPF